MYWGSQPLETIFQKVLDLQAHDNYNNRNLKKELKKKIYFNPSIIRKTEPI